jgi:hypothetical protein
MTEILERRYARLLRLYPADYRRARGAELLETLGESAEPGRTRPSVREATALVVGALRVRAGQDRLRSLGHTWLAALRVAALTLLVHDMAGGAARAVRGLAQEEFTFGILSLLDPGSIDLVATVLSACAVVAVTRGRYGSAMVAAGAGFLMVQLESFPMKGPSSGLFWQVPLAILFLLPLLRRPPVVVSGLLKYLPLVPLLLVALELTAAAVGPSFAPVQIGVLVVISAVGLVWLAVDERVAMALGLLLMNGLLLQVAFVVETRAAQLPAQMIAAVTLAAVAPAVLLGFGVTAARRQARL